MWQFGLDIPAGRPGLLHLNALKRSIINKVVHIGLAAACVNVPVVSRHK
jgi:hypothetical protein